MPSEISDFYVDRRRAQYEPGIFHNSVFADLATGSAESKGLNQLRRLYIPNVNVSEVRIPALLFAGPPDWPSSTKYPVTQYIQNQYRKQMGCHAMVITDGGLSVMDTFWQHVTKSPRIYQSLTLDAISSVYPCFANINQKSYMLLGLCYNDLEKGDNKLVRSFGRFDDNQQYGVFDIKQAFIDKKSKDSNYKELCPPGERVYSFAIYVCEGARLVIDDLCFHNDTENKFVEVIDSNGYRTRNKSLLQQGSLVMVRGTLSLQMGIYWSNQTPLTKEWKDAGNGGDNLLDQKQFSRALDDFERSVDKHQSNEPLNSQRQFVIFLGSTESQHNSICWRLKLNEFKGRSNGSGYSAELVAPEGGRILEIQSWNAGFAQILARHKYQRLYESVLTTSGAPTEEAMAFEVPHTGLCKKIWRINRKDFKIIVPLQVLHKMGRAVGYDTPGEGDKDFRRNLQKAYPTWTEIQRRTDDIDSKAKIKRSYKMQPHAPPLYPPFVSRSGRWHVPYNIEVTIGDLKRAKVVDQSYDLIDKVMAEYHWTRKCRASEGQSLLGKDIDKSKYRLGIDYWYYEKKEKIGQVWTLALTGHRFRYIVR